MASVFRGPDQIAFILAVDGFVGRDEVIIKPLQGVKPKGVAGATLSGDGSVVLILDMEELMATSHFDTRATLFSPPISTEPVGIAA